MTSSNVDQLTAFAIDDPVLAAIRAGRLPEVAVIVASLQVRDQACARLMEEIYELKQARARALRALRLP